MIPLGLLQASTLLVRTLNRNALWTCYALGAQSYAPDQNCSESLLAILCSAIVSLWFLDSHRVASHLQNHNHLDS